MTLVYKRSVGRGGRRVETWYGDPTTARIAHPWQTTASYDGGDWVVQVRPGFVNGKAPVWTRAIRNADNEIETPAVTLLDEPSIPIPKHILAGLQPVQLSKQDEAWFRRAGVNLRQSVSISGDSVSVDITRREGEGTRTLKSAQVYLAQARPTYQLTTTIIGNLITGDIVDTNVALDLSVLMALGPDPLIRAGVMPKQSQVSSGGGLPAATEDDGIDYLLVATVYFISPEDGDGEAVPDNTWSTYVRHNLFWNLFYSWKNDRPINIPRLGLGGLGALIGQFTFAPIATAGAIESITQMMLAQAFNNTKNFGKFWSA